MPYIDGFVAAVPTDSREVYAEHAREAAKAFKEQGALELIECWGDDAPEGAVTSVPMAVQCRGDETVVFSWIVWPSREVRNAAIEKIRNDPRLDPDANPMPLDGQRTLCGGFEVIVEAQLDMGTRETQSSPFGRGLGTCSRVGDSSCRLGAFRRER